MRAESTVNVEGPMSFRSSAELLIAFHIFQEDFLRHDIGLRLSEPKDG
jgi:hypothetical protein